MCQRCKRGDMLGCRPVPSADNCSIDSGAVQKAECHAAVENPALDYRCRSDVVPDSEWRD